MTFGDPTRFAVWFVVNEDHGGFWLHGILYFWIGGKQIGECYTLSDALSQITRIVKDSGYRENCALFQLTAEEIVRRLQMSLYSGNDPPMPDFIEFAAPYAIDIDIDYFDDWRIYLVECSGHARLLYKHRESSDVQEFTLNSGEFDCALRATWDQLDEWAEREMPKDESDET